MRSLASVTLAAVSASLCLAGSVPTRFHFEFSPGQTSQTAVYNTQRGYGFEDGAEIACSTGCASEKPFLFSVDVPEGNYDVKVWLVGQPGGSVVTLKGESRRLLLDKLAIPAGRSAVRKFTVNVRTSTISPTESVRLKPRENGSSTWDKKLTLEFNGIRPGVRAIDVERNEKAITVYLAGDSTVTDQTEEPWAAWGQMLPLFFRPGVAVANNAESGEALKSFVSERRFAKVLSTMKRGDYLFIQFAHNDQKPGGAHTDAFTTYKEHLKLFIGEARKRGATPVLVTSMHRRRFEGAVIANSLGDYPEAMRQTAKEENVALIDLNAMSKAFYEALGPEKSTKAFVHYPAGTFPGQNTELKDNTHFNAYGAYELARCIVEGIKQNRLPLARRLVPSPAFDPARPDPVESFSLPASPPTKRLTVPDGK